jgi:ketosteroid isomerase-like protein
MIAAVRSANLRKSKVAATGRPNNATMSQAVDAAFARNFLRRLHAAANAHDAHAVAALCADDVVWEDPAAPHTLHGRHAAAVER